MNWKKLCSNLSSTVSNDIGELQKMKLFTFQIK